MSQARPKTGRGSMGRGTLEQVISRATFVLSGYALHISMAYLLKGPSAYGLLGLMISVTNIARVLLSTGLPQATPKFIAEADEELAYPILRTSLKLQWIMAAAIIGVYVAGIPLWQDFLNDPTLAPYFCASAPSDPAHGNAFQVLLELLRRPASVHAPSRGSTSCTRSGAWCSPSPSCFWDSASTACCGASVPRS